MIPVSSPESDEYVHNEYVLLKSKIYQITEVNKRARIYVDTLLPTKISDCIDKVRYFNKLLTTDLSRSFKNVKIINSFSKFGDVRGLLHQHLSTDSLHLNSTGLSILSTCIKNMIFHSKRGNGSTGSRREEGTGGRGSSGGTVERQQGTVHYAGVAGRHRGGGRTNRGWRGRPQ